jgi:signal transduction histidine kinase
MVGLQSNDEEEQLVERVLTLTRDEGEPVVEKEVLGKAGLSLDTVSTIEQYQAEIERGAGVLLLTADVVTPAAVKRLGDVLSRQPDWSDIPVVLLAAEQEVAPELTAELNRLANLTIFERPVPVSTLITALHSALRTRRRQYWLRDQLEEREQRTIYLETILRSIPEAIFVGTRDAILITNEPALQLLGLATLEELEGGLEWALEHLDWRRAESEQRVRFEDSLLYKALHGERSKAEVVVFDHGRQKDCMLQISTAPIALGDELTGVVAISTDVTERKRTERALRDSEARFRASVESMLDSLGIYSAVRNQAGELVDFRLEYVNEAASIKAQPLRRENIGRRLLQVLPERYHQDMLDEYRRVVETGEPLAREEFVYEAEEDGSRQQQAFDIRAAKLGDGFVTTWREVTERKEAQEGLSAARAELEARVAERTAELTYANAMLGEQMEVRARAESELRQRNQELSALNMVTAAVSSSLELPDILATLQNLLSSELNIPGGMLYFYDSLHHTLDLRVHWGIPQHAIPFLNSPTLQGSGLDRVVAEQSSISGEFPEEFALWQEDSLNDGVSDWNCFITVPVIAKDEVLGVMCLYGDTKILRNGQLGFFETVGQQVGVAIQNARLYEDVLAKGERLQQLAQRIISVQEEERQRVSYELHDEAGQVLTALMLSLELTRASLPDELTAARRNISEAVELTGETMEQIRMLAHDLRTPSLDTIGLNPTLHGLCQDVAGRTGLSVKYTGSELPPVPDTLALSLYRVAQEALSNVVKHAEAENVKVTLTFDENAIQLSVEDDGKGFRPGATLYNTAHPGIGLPGLRERLETLGGNLTVISAPGDGTRLLATIPRAESSL